MQTVYGLFVLFLNNYFTWYKRKLSFYSVMKMEAVNL